jgi:hypothetical protein
MDRLHRQVGGLLTLEDAIACCDCIAKNATLDRRDCDACIAGISIGYSPF